VIFLLLRIPVVQTILARVATSYLTAELNTYINIERLEIKSFRSVSLKNLLIEDLTGDTILSSGEMSLTINNLFANSNLLHIEEISLKNADIRLRKSKGSNTLNLKFIIDYFKKGGKAKVDSIIQDTAKQENKFKWRLDRLNISDSRFIYNNQNKKPKPVGVDFSDIDVRIFDLAIANVKIEEDTFFVDINNISIKEKSGFKVDSVSCNLIISPKILQAQNLLVLTPKNDLDLDLKFSFNSFKDFKDFIRKVHIQTEIRPTTINLTEVGYFAPLMFAMDNNIKVMGRINGTVDNFKAKNFKFAYGKSTQFRGNVQMNGLPKVRETFSHFSIKDFTTTVKDVRQFRLPTDDVYIDLPEMLTRLGKIKIKGKFTGFYNDFVSYANFNTDIGQISTDILLQVNDKNDVEYKGKIATNGFNAGRFFSVEKYLKNVDMVADITGSGLTPENMKVKMEGIVQSLNFFNYDYNEIIIAGNLNNQKFTGNVDIIDDNINLDFNGSIDYSTNIHSYNFIAGIKDAKLQKINMAQRDTSMKISTTVNINLIGDQLDNMQGIIKIDSTVYTECGDKYRVNDFTLSITRDYSEYTLIRLFSDIADASIEGKYLLRDLPDNITGLFNRYLDTLFTDTNVVDTLLASQDFVFDLELKNTTPVTKLFVPELNVSQGTKIIGGYNSQINNLFLEGESPVIEYQGKKLENVFMDFYIEDNQLLLSTGSEKLFLSDTINIDSLNILCKAKNDSIHYSISWQNFEHKQDNYADLNGYLAFLGNNKMEFKFNKADITIADTLWSVSPDNLLSIDSNNILFNNLTFNSKVQGVKIDGVVSGNENDTLLLGFDNFDLSNLDLLMRRINIDLDGSINGAINISNSYNSPTFLSDITISDFHFNKEKLGEAVLKTNWNPESEAFDILGEIIYTGNIGKNKTLEVTGTYFPYRNNDNYNIDIKLNNYKLNTIEPFVKIFSSKIEGLASGEINLRGSKQKPDLLGEISLMRTKMKIDYLNVTYYLADKIYFDKNLIRFDNIIVYDSLNNQAVCSGKVSHDHLKDFRLDLNFETNNLIGLNTTRTQNEMFYGEALATGKVNIHGPLDNLTLDISARSEKGTNIKIPISYSTEVTQNDYIIFVNAEEDFAEEITDYDVDLKGVSVNLNLEVTHDADIQIFLPYQMGNLKGRGNGDIIMKINPDGDLTMEGSYVIYKGSFFLTLQNIINRDFDIKRGSKLVWTGDPYNAQINLKAVYKIKTTLGEYGPPEDSTTRVPVDCVIALSNKLLDPEIRFSIEFPDLKESQKDFIYSRLDTNDQAMMSQQMISLLVLNSFYYSSGSTGSVGFNTFSLVTNQLNNWLSQISNDFDIGVNYRPGDDISSDEVEVALSTQLFDDRVLIDGNVGVKGSEDAQRTNDLVGEVTVEVKITPDGRFRAKAFNKSNNNYLYKNYAPYTQGVGVFYTKEFYKFSDLFRRKNKKPKIEDNKNVGMKE